MPRGRPRSFDSEQALDTALHVFWRQGYEGTSVAELTAAMRISPPSLYAAFGNKQELFEQVLQRYLQGPAAYLPNALKQPTARQAVAALFDGAINLAMTSRPPTGCLLVQGALATGPGGQAARAMLRHTRAAAEAAVRNRLQQAPAHQLPPHAKPAALARYIVTLIWGLSVQAASGADRADLQAVANLALGGWPNSPPATR